MSEHQEVSNSPEEEVSRIEAILQEQLYVPLEDQQILREFLKTVPRIEQALRDRVIALLNPRRVGVVHLSDAEFREDYCPTTDDNYSFHDIRAEDIFASFDAAHGYYVTLRITVIE